MDQEIDIAGLRKYFGRNSSNLLQTRIGNELTVWTYAPGDTYAAERAARMTQRMGTREFTHAQKARMRTRGGTFTEVVIVTEFPSGKKTVIELASGAIRNERIAADDALNAFCSVLSVGAGSDVRLTV